MGGTVFNPGQLVRELGKTWISEEMEKEAKTVQHLSVVVVQRGNPVVDMPPHCMLINFFCSFLPIYLNFLSSLIIHSSIIIQ